MKKLTIKEKKFVANRISGKTIDQSYKDAGYSVTDNKNATHANAMAANKRPHIQEAIDKALEFHGATPEFAVGRLKQIAEQEKEVGAARLASKDILELHGWNKADRPTLQLDIKNAFFGNARQDDQTRYVEAE